MAIRLTTGYTVTMAVSNQSRRPWLYDPSQAVNHSIVLLSEPTNMQRCCVVFFCLIIMLNHHNDVFRRSQNPPRNMAPPPDKGLLGG